MFFFHNYLLGNINQHLKFLTLRGQEQKILYYFNKIESPNLININMQ